MYYATLSSNNNNSFTVSTYGDEYVYDYRKHTFAKLEDISNDYKINIFMRGCIGNNCSSVFITDEIWNKHKQPINQNEKLYKSSAVFGFDGKLINGQQYPYIELKWDEIITKKITEHLPLSTFKDDIARSNLTENVYLSDIYGSKNISTVEFGFKKEHTSNAPILIRTEFYVAEDLSGEFKLVWEHSDEYDFDIRDTYKDEFDLVKVQKNIVKQFTSLHSGKDYAKHCFGVRFTIEQITPQINEKNSAIIDYMKINVSNITNKYGNSVGINDVYVRKCDANCRNYYNMDVSEYVWRLPNSMSEWKTLSAVLAEDNEGDKSLIDSDHYNIITTDKIQSSFFNDTLSSNNFYSISDQLTSSNFLFRNAFYITNDVAGRSIKEVLSDSYLVDSNMKVTWKYVDYVYISYSCYGGNSRMLLEKYFGDKILKAVKSKLINNIESMNANSAFKDRFEFSGGIMVSKEESINAEQHTDVFKWNTSQKIEKNWSKVYTKTTTEVEKATPQPIYETTEKTYVQTYKNKKFSSETLMKTNTTTSGKSTISRNTLTKTEVNDRLDDVKDHYGATIENAKYSSVDNWLNSIQPIMLKYKIN